MQYEIRLRRNVDSIHGGWNWYVFELPEVADWPTIVDMGWQFDQSLALNDANYALETLEEQV